MATIEEALIALIERWQGPAKLCMLITGGGMAIIDALKIPRASRVFHSVDVPYSSESQADLLQRGLNLSIDPNNWKSVSEDAVKLYAEALKNLNHGCLSYVVISAALTSFKIDPETNKKRGRRGVNSAFVVLNDKSYRIDINKLSDEEIEEFLDRPALMRLQRQIEDNKIAQAVISLMLDDPSLMPNWDENESCTRL
jgi:hypothetical protein